MSTVMEPTSRTAICTIAEVDQTTNTRWKFPEAGPIVFTPIQLDTTPVTKAISPADVNKAFLESLYDYSGTREIAHGSLLVLKFVDGLLKNGDLKGIDAILQQIDCWRLHPEIGLSLLMVTAPIKGKLSALARRVFLNRVKGRFLESRSAAYVAELLGRYE